MSTRKYPDDFINKIICGDCLEAMKEMPDECVDLVLTDPPYGLEWKSTVLFGKKCPQTTHIKSLQSWDKKVDKAYFVEMRRVSREQVIWGGNYYGDILGSCKSPLIWNKLTGNNNYADGEMAWTSFAQGTLRIFTHQWCGAFKDSERGLRNWHPTQKPQALMEWVIDRYTDEGDLILDPFLGSGTTIEACKLLHRNFIGIEINPDYCKIAEGRLAQGNF